MYQTSLAHRLFSSATLAFASAASRASGWAKAGIIVGRAWKGRSLMRLVWPGKTGLLPPSVRRMASLGKSPALVHSAADMKLLFDGIPNRGQWFWRCSFRIAVLEEVCSAAGLTAVLLHSAARLSHFQPSGSLFLRTQDHVPVRMFITPYFKKTSGADGGLRRVGQHCGTWFATPTKPERLTFLSERSREADRSSRPGMAAWQSDYESRRLFLFPKEGSS
jgi:hypothetical protein